MSVLLHVTLAIVGLLALLAVYLLPTIVAASGRTSNRAPVIIVNVSLGWRLLGWVVTLAMAAAGKQEAI